MKALIAWLTRNQTCACGGFKLARAATCFDCTLPPAEIVELADRKPGRHAA
jgi:hypothetical protein